MFLCDKIIYFWFIIFQKIVKVMPMANGKKKSKKQSKRKKKEKWRFMPVCDLCGESEDTLYKCKKCGVSFCEWCGSIEDGFCSDCFEEVEYDEDEPEPFEAGEDVFYRRSG